MWASLIFAVALAMPPPANPGYVPSAHHATRPHGAIFNDEVGKNIIGTPYRRVIEVFGPPLRRDGNCIRYRLVGEPGSAWEFCFSFGRMKSAYVRRQS